MSLLLSLWMIQTSDTINRDGTLYIDMARLITQNHWQDTLWQDELFLQIPYQRLLFYVFSIATFAWVFPVELQTAAHLLNTILLAIMSWLFIAILMAMNAKRSILIAGLIVITIHPYINDYRAEIIRGPGGWMFLLLYVWLTIQFFNNAQLKYFIASLLSLLLMTLFRLEGLSYMILAPLLLLTHSSYRNRQGMIFITKTYIILIGLAALIMAPTMLNHVIQTDTQSTYLIHLHNMNHYLSDIFAATKTHILSEPEKLYIYLLTIMTTPIKALTPFFLIIVIGLYSYRPIRATLPYPLFFLSLIAINYLYMAYGVMIYGLSHLSGRYAMPAALIVALIASYGITWLFQQSQAPAYRYLRILTVMTLFIMTIDGLYSFGDSKRYIRNGGQWASQQLQADEKLLTNDTILDYYGGIKHTGQSRKNNQAFTKALEQGTIDWSYIEKHHYLLLKTKRIQPDTLSQLQKRYAAPILQWPDQQNPKLQLYKLSND